MILRPIRFAAPSSRTIVFIVIMFAAARADAQDPAHDSPYELWKINTDGTGLARLAETPGYTCGSPDWSPDGKQIAYDTWRSGQSFDDSQIAVIRADGSQRHLLGPGAMPSWSPDGTQLVCHTYDSPQTIIVMNADGSGRETILNHWGSPRWLPRGNRIASIGVNRGIAVLDLATGTERSILPGLYSSNHGFSVSPDGRQFCFGDSGGGVALATLDEQGMQASVRWLVKSGNSYHSTWSPDGSRLVFNWQPPGQDLEQLYVWDIDSTNAPIPLPGQDSRRRNACPTWSPDGKTIIFASQAP